MSCCLATKQSYTQIFLLMTDTTLHETSQVFRWGTYVWNLSWLSPSQTPSIKAYFNSQGLMSAAIVLYWIQWRFLLTWSPDARTHTVYIYIYSTSCRNCSRGMNRSEAEWGGRHELHCVHNASWVFFKGGGMTPHKWKPGVTAKGATCRALKIELVV